MTRNVCHALFYRAKRGKHSPTFHTVCKNYAQSFRSSQIKPLVGAKVSCMFEDDLIGFDTSVGKRRPLKSDMVVNSAEGRQFHRLPPMNATEPLGCRKYFHAPARNTRASMDEPIPFNCKCFFSVVQSMLEARHVAVLMTISPRSATEAKRAAMFTVSPTAVMS
jgi:hypothetical protein